MQSSGISKSLQMQKSLHWFHAERHRQTLPRNVQARFLKPYFKCLPCFALNKLYPHKATRLLLRSCFSSFPKWPGCVTVLDGRYKCKYTHVSERGKVYDFLVTSAAHLLRKSTKVQNVYVILWSAVITLNQYRMRRTEERVSFKVVFFAFNGNMWVYFIWWVKALFCVPIHERSFVYIIIVIKNRWFWYSIILLSASIIDLITFKLLFLFRLYVMLFILTV